MPPRSPLRLGLYGGSFDPIHLAHIIMAYDALEQARLDELWFIPCRKSPHKEKDTEASGDQRVDMLNLLCKREARFQVSRLEIDRTPPSFSIDTVEAIRRQYPQAELFWLLGQDQFNKLGTWHRPADLIAQVTFLLFTRTEVDPDAGLVPEVGANSAENGLNPRMVPIRSRHIDISATEVRRRCRAGSPIHHLVSPFVADYIDEHRLYRGY